MEGHLADAVKNLYLLTTFYNYNALGKTIKRLLSQSMNILSKIYAALQGFISNRHRFVYTHFNIGAPSLDKTSFISLTRFVA